MSQLQYIGARYVPIWYVNTDDQSADWQPNVEYEPLTFVTTTNNHLYLSKKEVPDTIGNPANNMAYWLDMGVFTNAQIAQLQDEVDALELTVGDLTNLNTTDQSSIVNAINELVAADYAAKDHIILVGDSYAAYLGDLFADVEAALPDVDITSTATGGSSFANAQDPNENSYYKLLQNLNITAEKKQIINRIIIMGGYNEQNNPTNIVAGVNTTIAYIKSEFPNAKVEYMPVGRNVTPSTDHDVQKYDDEACRRLEALDCHVYNNARWIMSNNSYFYTDGVHPNSDGKAALKKYLIDAILFHDIDVYVTKYTSTSAAGGNNFTVSGAVTFKQHNDKVTIIAPQLAFSIDSGDGRMNINGKTSMGCVNVAGVILEGKLPLIDYPQYCDGNLKFRWHDGSARFDVVNMTTTSDKYGVVSGETMSTTFPFEYKVDLAHTFYHFQ